MANNKILIMMILISSFHLSTSSTTTTAYDALQSHGLPIGLLPKGVSNFAIDEESGRFEIHLDNPCTAKFESEVRYDSVITGTISYGQIVSLSGVTAQELFLWFPVKEIRVDVPSSGLIYFDVGVIYKQFSLSLFETPHECYITSFQVIVMNQNNNVLAIEKDGL